MTLLAEDILLDSLAADPPLASDGQLWWNDSEKKFKTCRSGKACAVNDRQVNDSATTDPTATDDSSSDYEVGSLWINVSTDKIFICVDATVSAAVWKDVSSVGGGGSIAVEDEGTPLTTAVTKFDFAGAGVTVTEPVADEVLVTIAGITGNTDGGEPDTNYGGIQAIDGGAP